MIIAFAIISHLLYIIWGTAAVNLEGLPLQSYGRKVNKKKKNRIYVKIF